MTRRKWFRAVEVGCVDDPKDINHVFMLSSDRKESKARLMQKSKAIGATLKFVNRDGKVTGIYSPKSGWWRNESCYTRSLTNEQCKNL